MNCIKSSKFK